MFISTNIKTSLSNVAATVSQISGLKASAYIGTDGLFDSKSIDSYVVSLQGLSRTQAETALAAAGLDSAQKRQVLSAFEASAATKTLTAEQALQAIATTNGSTADAKALLIKSGLASADEIEKNATIQITEAKIDEAVANHSLSASDANVIKGSLGITTANAGETASFGLLTKAVWANIKAMAKWLITTPAGWATLAVGAVVSLISAYNNVEKKQNELIDNAQTLQEEYRNTNKTLSDNISSLEKQKDEFKELSKGVDDYGNNISLSTPEYDKYKSVVSEILGYSPELIEGYNKEGNAIANKNSLIERSIELLKQEQKQKLKKATSDDKTGEVYEGAKAAWEKTKGYEGTHTRNQIARWFDDNAMSNGWSYKYDVAKILGIEDEWQKEGNNLQVAIIHNIETVAKNIKAKKQELLDLKDGNGESLFTEDEIEGMVDKADTWQQQYADWQRDIEDAKHGMDDQFGLYAQKADGYDKLTDAQKAFVTNYIKATGDIVDADGRILSEDEIIEKAKGYTKFVEKLATDPNFDGARENINKLFSLDKSKMSAGEYEKQVEAILKELQDKFKLSDDEVLGFKIALGFTFVSDGNTTVKTMVDGVKAKLQNEAQQEAESKKIDLSQIIFGNIDLNNRKILDWTDENIEKYKSALESWGQSIEKYRGDISTVDGRSEEFDGVEIAFSPILQTENGAEYLDSDTVHRYINSLIEKAGEGWTNEDLFKLDAKGLEVDGKQIKGLIADIGETAIKTGESMHFLGTDGAINLGWKNIEEELNSLNFEDLQKAYNIISNLLEGTLLSWDKLQEKINATSDSVKGVTSSLTSLKDAVKSAEDAFELFNDVQKDFKSSGVISSENIQKILAKFPDLEDELYEYIMGLRTGASVIDLLKTKSDNMATMSAEAFRKMYMSSTAVSASMKKQFASAFKYVGLEWDNTQSVMANVNSQIIDNNGNVCTTFADQWTNACKAAGVSVSTFASGLASLFSGGVDNIIKENGNLYSEDKVSGEKVNLVDVQAVKIAQDLNDKKSESEYWNRYGKYVSNGKVDKDAIYSDVSKRFHGIYNEGISNKEELEKKQKEFEEALKKNVIDSGSSSSKDKKDKSKDTPFDDSYYSAIDAWLEEAKKQIENLEKESEKLNRQLENAMDSANKEQTEILRKKIAENAKAQKDLLHEQNEAHRITQQELLQSLYAYAPSLKGLSFDEISEVDLYNIETTLTKANENAADDDAKNSTSYSLNQFKGIVDDLKALSNEIEDNSEKWWTLDENAKGYWQSQIDFQSEYSQTWIDNQKAFDKLTDEEELAAYSRMINNNKGFQKQILNDVSLSEEAKLVLIKETNDKIVEIEKEAYSLRQEMIENLKSDLTEEIDEKISAFEDLTNDKIDRLNHRASQYSSLRTLLQSYYDTINAVSDAQHEINKELAVSMTLYEYLNEETRKLLFNQEDYNTLNQKLLEIESQANLLQEEYNDDILAATKENIEEITSQYQMQYETLMKSYEIAKAELEVAKKKQQLNNVLAERNVRMFIDGQWQWVANTQDVQNAQTELADAQYEAQKAKTSLEQQESLNELTKSQDKITTQINYIETDLETIREKWQEMQKQIEDESFNLTSVLSELAEIDSPKLQSVIASVSDSLEEFAKEIKSIKDDLDSSSSGSSSSRHAFGGSFVKGVSNTVKVSTAHARGTGNTSHGNALMGEDGAEIYIDGYGRLIPVLAPTIFKDIPSGGKVFNEEQMKNLSSLWNLSNFKMPDYSNLMKKAQNSVVNNDNSYHVHFQNLELDNSIIDIDKLKRYVGTH